MRKKWGIKFAVGDRHRSGHPCLQGSKSVYDFIDGMKEASDGVKRISLELKELQRVLKTNPTQDNAVPIVRRVSQEMGLEKVVATYDEACLDLGEKLKQTFKI